MEIEQFGTRSRSLNLWAETLAERWAGLALTHGSNQCSKAEKGPSLFCWGKKSTAQEAHRELKAVDCHPSFMHTTQWGVASWDNWVKSTKEGKSKVCLGLGFRSQPYTTCSSCEVRATFSCATFSSGICFSRGFGLDDFQRSLPISVSIWKKENPSNKLFPL